jgi:hypothetical protein
MSFLSKLLRTRLTPIAGDLYSIVYGNGSFVVAKLLVVEPSTVHLRIYKNKFPDRPDDVDTSALELGTIHDIDGCGIGHVPLATKEFSGMSPEFIKHVGVDRDELDGYEEWKEEDGGVWGADT